MRVGWFELNDPVPDLSNPHVFAIITNWLNAGQAASMAISALESFTSAKGLGNLAQPSKFFDFTRYRPELIRDGETAKIRVTTASLSYAKSEPNDFVFLRMPEPHMKSEEYIDSIIKVFQYLGVKRYCLLGATYEMLPYTRPILVTGDTSVGYVQDTIQASRVIRNDYQGETSILNTIAQQVECLGIETLDLVAHLPGYLQMERDHRGEVSLLEVVHSLYGIPVPQDDSEQASKEVDQVRQSSEAFLNQNPQLKIMLKQLEANYDSRVNNQKQTKLPIEFERFLRELRDRPEFHLENN